MKTSQLMLGDLVMYYGSVSRIDGLWQDIVHIEGEPEEQYADMQEIEPLPLTAEILEANGFEEYKHGVYKLVTFRFVTETDTIIIEPMKIESRIGNKWYWFVNNDREGEVAKPRLTYPFVYVHEL